MGETTKIAWTDHTFNPWWGCQRVSPGCEHCYAETFAKRVGLKVWGPQSERRFFGDKHWAEPLKWNRKALAVSLACRREGFAMPPRPRVFCASMADVFEDRADLVEPRARLWRLVVDTPHLDWLLLTKRPENAHRLWEQARILSSEPEGATWQENVWLGTTAEDQRRANERLPHLLKVPAVVRFVSYEPALEAVDFSQWIAPRTFCGCGAEYDGDVSCTECSQPGSGLITTWGHEAAEAERAGRADGETQSGPPIHWVIVGGESGPSARPFDAAWARETVDQCKAAGVTCFVKQMGSRPYDSNVNASDWPDAARFVDLPEGVPIAVAGAGVMLQHPKGEDPAEWPEDLRVREWPEVTP